MKAVPYNLIITIIMIMYYSLIELPIILDYDKDKNNKRYILKSLIHYSLTILMISCLFVTIIYQMGGHIKDFEGLALSIYLLIQLGINMFIFYKFKELIHFIFQRLEIAKSNIELYMTFWYYFIFCFSILILYITL